MDNELKEALKEHGASMEKKSAELVDAAKAEAKAALEGVQAEVKKAQEEVTALKAQANELDVKIKKREKEMPEDRKTFIESLRETLTKEAEKIKGMNKTKVAALQLEVKSFLETNTASVTTGSLIPTPQFEAGISKAPDRMPFMLDLVQKGVANSLTIYWSQRKTRTDNSGTVTEGTVTKLAGGSVEQSVLGYETKNASMQNILAFIKVSNNSVDDIDWLMSEIQTELVTLMMLKLDGYLLTGTTAANGFNGILTGATAFSAAGDKLAAGVVANKFDALAFALTQVRLANFEPNYIILNPADVRDMRLVRDDGGAYLLPPTMAVNGLSVDGVRVIANNGMPKGSYLVGDFNRAKFWTRKGMELSVYEQNEDDAINQLKTVTLYMRGTLVVKDADALAFVTDTFVDTMAEITAAVEG